MPDYVHSGGYVSLMAFDEWKPATPADIAAAHPKCGTCDYVREFKDCGETLWHECENRQSAYWADHVNPLTDYCPHHS